MRYYRFGILFFITTYSAPAIAGDIRTHDDLVHLSAHIGTSYMINVVTYGALRKWTDLSPATSVTVSALGTLAIGYLYKWNEKATWEETQVSMFRNSIGVAGAVSSILVFHF